MQSTKEAHKEAFSRNRPLALDPGLLGDLASDISQAQKGTVVPSLRTACKWCRFREAGWSPHRRGKARILPKTRGNQIPEDVLRYLNFILQAMKRPPRGSNWSG